MLPGLQLSYLGIYGNGNQQADIDWRVNALFASWESRHLVVTGQRYWGRGNSKGDAVGAGWLAQLPILRSQGFRERHRAQPQSPEVQRAGARAVR